MSVEPIEVGALGSVSDMCGKAELERTDGTNTPERVVENESLNVLWDFSVKCNRMVEARGPDIDFMNKQAMEAKIIDIAF